MPKQQKSHFYVKEKTIAATVFKVRGKREKVKGKREEGREKSVAATIFWWGTFAALRLVSNYYFSEILTGRRRGFVLQIFCRFVICGF